MAHPALHEIPEFRQVSDRLVTGGQPTSAHLAAVAANGYEVVINLGVPTSPYALRDEASIAEGLGIEYIAIPVDWEAPTEHDATRFLDAMHHVGDRRVLVHCARNMRASVFAALHMVHTHAWDANDAHAFVRGVWEPNPTWSAFFEHQIARLVSTEPGANASPRGVG